MSDFTPLPWPLRHDDDDAPDFTWPGNYHRAKECVEACDGMRYPVADVAALRHRMIEAIKLIGYIGTTGVERTDVIQRAEKWLDDVVNNTER